MDMETSFSVPFAQNVYFHSCFVLMLGKMSMLFLTLLYHQHTGQACDLR